MEWEPEDYNSDPMVNAVLNVAHAIHRQANATQELLYALKYSKAQGMSVAEAIEVAGNAIAENVADAARTIAESIPEAAANISPP